MNTIEDTFGIGCDLHKVTMAMLEPDEDVVLDENGQSVEGWEQIVEGVAV